MPLPRPKSIRAKMVSLGGGILLSLVLFLGVVTLAAVVEPQAPPLLRALLVFLFFALLLYLLDSWSEHLWLEGSTVFFDSWLKRRRRVDLSGVQEILLVHEGLNLERGIETLRFRRGEGDDVVFALGPLWHRHHLEAFLAALEQSTGRRKMVEEVR
jgi:hypothetical protein